MVFELSIIDIPRPPQPQEVEINIYKNDEEQNFAKASEKPVLLKRARRQSVETNNGVESYLA